MVADGATVVVVVVVGLTAVVVVEVVGGGGWVVDVVVVLVDVVVDAVVDVVAGVVVDVVAGGSVVVVVLDVEVGGATVVGVVLDVGVAGWAVVVEPGVLVELVVVAIPSRAAIAARRFGCGPMWPTTDGSGLGGVPVATNSCRISRGARSIPRVWAMLETTAAAGATMAPALEVPLKVSV
jgi:hypothetical protein